MAIREAERERLIDEVQRLTGRPVLHDSFQFQPERNLAIELFWVPTGSADGAATLQPPRRSRRPTRGTRDASRTGNGEGPPLAARMSLCLSFLRDPEKTRSFDKNELEVP